MELSISTVAESDCETRVHLLTQHGVVVVALVQVQMEIMRCHLEVEAVVRAVLGSPRPSREPRRLMAVAVAVPAVPARTHLQRQVALVALAEVALAEEQMLPRVLPIAAQDKLVVPAEQTQVAAAAAVVTVTMQVTLLQLQHQAAQAARELLCCAMRCLHHQRQTLQQVQTVVRHQPTTSLATKRSRSLATQAYRQVFSCQ